MHFPVSRGQRRDLASRAADIGALASGIGRAFRYAALPGLSRTRAATVRLLAPALAAAGGVPFLAEPPSVRLVAGGGCILAGVRLCVRRSARLLR